MVGDRFATVLLPKAQAERVIPLTPEQVALIAEVIGPCYRPMVVALSGLGLRIGELLALRTQDVDFLRRTVRVEHQVDQDTSLLIPPKTRRSKRVIPLPNVVGAALAEHLRLSPPSDRDG